MNIKIFLVVIFALGVTACKQESAGIPTYEPLVITTSTTLPIATRTSTIEPTSTELATAVATVTPSEKILDFTDIKSGQYVIVEDFQTEIPFLHVVSKDKQIVKSLSLESYLELQHDTGSNTDSKLLHTNFDVSSDGTQLLAMHKSPKSSVLFDISSGNSTLLSIDQECQSASWSPDKKFIALSCLTSEIAGEIFILDTVSGQISQVTDCHNDYQYCYSASWSPDGHWLAYYQSDERSGQHPQGIMIFNTNCFKNNNCMNERMGLIEADSNPIWSPQSQLVYVKSGILSYVEIKDSQPNQVHANYLPIIPADLICRTIKHSPDGNDFACTTYERPKSNIYIYSPMSNTFDLIFSSGNSSLNLIGWINVP
jgi:hypothetical protein